MSFNFPVLRMSQEPEVATRFVALSVGAETLMQPTGGLVRFQFTPRPESVRRVVGRLQTRKEAGGSPDAEARDYARRPGDGLAGSRLVKPENRSRRTVALVAQAFQPAGAGDFPVARQWQHGTGKSRELADRSVCATPAAPDYPTASALVQDSQMRFAG